MILTKFHTYGDKAVNLFINGQFKAPVAHFMIQSLYLFNYITYVVEM